MLNPTTVKLVSVTLLAVLVAVKLNLENLEYKHRIDNLELRVKSQDAFIKAVMLTNVAVRNKNDPR